MGEVRLKTRHVVKPAEPTIKGIHPLSELDQVSVISHASFLYFYKNRVVFDVLKDSLSRALVAFYPLAGRLSWVAGRRLQLECNAMGAELIEAESSDKIITDFGDFVDVSRSMFRDLLPHLDYSNTTMSIEMLPLLSVQVTSFACGGVCLGIQFSHVVMDGRSVFHFLKEWARLARGEPCLEVTPYLDRLLLKYAGHVPNLEMTNNKVVDAAFAQVADSYSSNVHHHDETTELLSPTLVLVTAAQIERLKKAVHHQDDHIRRLYSRFEVITAHVWRCMTMARQLDPHQVTALYVIADGRTRLNPPLPCYFGNVVVPVTASSSAGELTSRPLSYACSKVREAIQQLSHEYITETIEFLGKEESLENHQFLEDRGDLVGSSKRSNDIWVTSLLNLVAQGLDFGSGNEVYAGPPTGLGDDGNTLILPHNREHGSVKVAVWLEPEKCLKIFKFFTERLDKN